MNFEQLVKRAQAGNTEEMEVIINAFRPLVINLKKREKYRIINDEAESFAHCTIIELVHSFRGPDYNSFPGYLKKMLTFAFNNFCRKQMTILSYEATNIDENMEDFFYLNDTQTTAAVRITLQEALEQLPERQRRIIHSYYWEDKTDSTISKEMQLSRNTINTLRAKALANLKQLLQ